ncbi:hypothetical protein SHIRM173S_02269 [Streptomyces hirsutus]
MRSAASARWNCSSSSSARAFAALALIWVELPDHLQVLAAGQVLVDRRELAGQADGAAHGVRLLEHVDTGDHRLSAVGPQQGGQTADGGGLARAVRPEQAQDGALGDIEVDAVGLPLTLPKVFTRPSA